MQINLTENTVYKKISNISSEVKTKLFRKGLVVPKKNNDNSISVGRYLIKKINGLYTIANGKNCVILENINLPQTAILIANKLALWGAVDYNLFLKDQSYGSTLFEDELYTQRIDKHTDEDYRQVMLIKRDVVREKRDFYKQEIEESFQKLMRIA
jgi:hypothetical protein